MTLKEKLDAAFAEWLDWLPTATVEELDEERRKWEAQDGDMADDALAALEAEIAGRLVGA